MQPLATTSLAAVPAPSGGPIELSVVMPCLNEAETLARCIVKANRFFADHGVCGEVVIADNGSVDGSQAIAADHGARVVDVPVRGYGAALAAGIAAAHGRFVAMGDSDDSYDFGALMPFLERLRAGDALVMGNRFQGGIAPGAMPLLHRYLGNPVLSFTGRLLYGAPAGDFHCGLRAFDRAAILRLGLNTRGMEFASEMVVKAQLSGLRISEVPTTLVPDGRSRPPHLNSWRDGWRHLKFLLTHAPNWLFFGPGLGLAGLGLVGMALLLPGQVRIGDIGLGLGTLVFAASAVALGAQLISFGVVARLYGVRLRLWPETAWTRRLERWFSIDRGVVGGALLLLGGVVLAAVAVRGWASSGFGDQDVEAVMRLAIPATLLFSLGLQAIFTGFLVALSASR